MDSQRVLIADRDHITFMVVSEKLRTMGFEVRQASTGTEALDVVASWEPHLLIMDVNLPEIDGYEVCDRIQFEHKETSPRVIFFTEEDDDWNFIQGMAYGADHYIAKSLGLDFLIDAIHSKMANA